MDLGSNHAKGCTYWFSGGKEPELTKHQAAGILAVRRAWVKWGRGKAAAFLLIE